MLLRDVVTSPGQVILKLSNQVTTWMGEQQRDHPNQTFRQLRQQTENLQVNL